MENMTLRPLTACLLVLSVGAGCAPEGSESAPAMLLEGRPSGQVTEDASANSRAPNPANGANAAKAGDAASSFLPDGRAVETDELTQTVAELCRARLEAFSDPRAAKATYERSRAGIETATRALAPSYALAAASLAEARDAVEGDLAPDPPRPTLDLNLGLLTERMRAGLARLGIRSAPCKR
jgi:hypothetical protein